MENLGQSGLSRRDGHAFRIHSGFLGYRILTDLAVFGGFSASCYEDDTQSEDCYRCLSSLNETHDFIAGY